MITLTAEITINNETIVLDYSRITSIDISIFDRSDLSKPSYGIISNSGELVFNDYDSKFSNYASLGLLTENLSVVITLTNNLSKNTQQLSKFKTGSWDYDSNNKIVKVLLKDDLEEWQEINIQGINYDPVNSTPKSLYEIYSDLYDKTPQKYNMLAPKQLDANTTTILLETTINYVFMEMGTLWRHWNNLCLVSQSHIFKNDQGETMFVYKGGI